MEIVRKLLNFDLPYSWQLIHELQINKEFMLNEYMIITNEKNLRLIRLLMKYKQQEDIEDLRISLKNKDSNLGELLKNYLSKFVNMFIDITEECCGKFLDIDLIIHMIMNNSFSNNELSKIISYCFDKIIEYSKIESKSLYEEKDRIYNMMFDTNYDIFDVCEDMSSLFRKQRMINLNISLICYRKYFVGSKGYQYEKDEVIKAINSGELKLDRTCIWLLETKKSMSDSSNIFNVHREAFKNLLCNLSFIITKNTPKKILPEIMVLDTDRIDIIIKNISTYSLYVSLITYCNKIGIKNNKKYLESYLLSLSNRDTIEDISLYLSDFLGIDSKIICKNISVLLGHTSTSVRYIITNRILNYITNENVELHSSLSYISNEIEELKNKLFHLISHYEIIYLSLYCSILNTS